MNKTGGSVFPVSRAENQDGKVTVFVEEEGMTLRDKFADSALKGFCSQAEPTRQIHFDSLAEDAYRMADAMLSAREVGNE